MKQNDCIDLIFSNMKDIVNSQVKVKLYPELISTKPEKLAITHDNQYVVYLTEIGVQLGKGMNSPMQ